MKNKQELQGRTGSFNRFRVILILGILTAYVPFSVDTYLPAMPNIADFFGTTSARMTYSLSTFFMGFALALAPIRKNLDTASALVGMIRIGIAGLASASIGLLKATDSIPVAGMMMVTTFLSFLVVMNGLRRMRKKRVKLVQ